MSIFNTITISPFFEPEYPNDIESNFNKNKQGDHCLSTNKAELMFENLFGR